MPNPDLPQPLIPLRSHTAKYIFVGLLQATDVCLDAT
jgi:hypothetical protein